MIALTRQYGLAIVVSVLLHGLLIFAVVKAAVPAPPKKPDFKRPEFVKATLVELKAKAPEQKTKTSKVKKVDLTAKRKQAEAEKKRRQAEAQAKKQREQKERQQKLAKEKKAKEKAAREKAAREQAQRDKAAAEKKSLEEARKRQEEALQKALREEEIMLAQQAEAQVVNSYKAIITERIIQRWSRPPSARNGMQCKLVIQLVPTGKIITVNVVESSGNAAFDRSAEQAVKAVEQIPELQSMDIAVFERNFRTIHLLFKPGDLRL